MLGKQGRHQTLGDLLHGSPSLRIEEDNITAGSLDIETTPEILSDHHAAAQQEKARSWTTSSTGFLISQPEHAVQGPQVDDAVRGNTNTNTDGAFLTWDDLCVTASDSSGRHRPILQGATGYAEPGQVLAIMGPSGCGKSTLLDALAGYKIKRRHQEEEEKERGRVLCSSQAFKGFFGRLQSNTCQLGAILVNGRNQTLAFGTSAYVTQDDILMTTLTVREAIYYSAQLQLPDVMSNSEKMERIEKTIEEMGLQDSKDTRIGGQASRGLSGGQKRRVCICLEILTRPKLLFLDEPTSGLDSAASFHVMNRIVGLAQCEGMTIISSIHQPGSEVFQLFDNICLLSSGKTIYFGPTSMTSKFFSANGFPCPSMRNPSDHFLRIINKDFEKEAREICDDRITTVEAINILVTSYRSSNDCIQVMKRVLEINNVVGRKLKKGNQASFSTQCIILTKRSFVNMYRDTGYYWFRFAIYAALCLSLGTMFQDIGHSYGSIQARGSLLLFVSGFLTFMAIGGFPSFIEDMKIFRRERLNGHYGVTAFVIGNSLSSIPYLALISIIPAAMTYFLVGLQRSFEHFSFYALVLYTTMLLVESLMMVVASIVPNYLTGIITGAGIQGVMILCGGFFRLPNDIPKPVWKFPVYHIAFHKYANQAYYKNEFIGLHFPSNQGNGTSIITGEEVVLVFWQMEEYSKWVDVLILFGMVVTYRILFLVIMKTNEKIKPLVRAVIAVASKPAMQVMEQPSTSISDLHV